VKGRKDRELQKWNCCIVQLLSMDKKLKSVHLDWRSQKYYVVFAESKNCGGRETAVAR
jgi:hypothetical protein